MARLHGERRLRWQPLTREINACGGLTVCLARYISPKKTGRLKRKSRDSMGRGPADALVLMGSTRPRQGECLDRGEELHRFDDALLDAIAAVLDAAKG